LLNIFVAMFALATFSRRLRYRRALWFGSFVVVAGLLAGLAYSAVIRSFAEQQLFADAIIYTEQTPYQRILVTKHEFDGRLRLYLDGHIQFSERDEYRYHEALVHPALAIPGKRMRVLILGGGDGLAAREVLKYDDVERIDLVDIDERMTTLCNSFEPLRKLNQGSLSHPKLHVHNLDAFNFVRQAGDKYDRVILDFPDPRNEALTKLYSVEFYRLLRRVVNDDAYVVTQSSSPYFTREVYWCIAQTLEAAGFQTFSYQIYVPSFGIWGFHLAGAGGSVPRSVPIPVPTRFLTAEVMARADVFAPDDDRVEVPVNSLDQPHLYRLYEMCMKQ
jgi:spermidine synthase